MLRESFGRSLRRLAVIAAAGLVPGALQAQQSTGKIQGRVTDSATGAPIANAQLSVQGTTLGNITNQDGFYFINEVPAGLQSVKAQLIGYRSVVISDQRILAGQTTTLNFQLEQTAVQLQALTVEGQRNPLVPRDQTASKAIVRGQTVDELPLDNASQIVVLQPGVVETNCVTSSGALGQCRAIRGGRPNEEAVFIDGVLVRSFGTGRAGDISLPTNALEQVDVTVGAFSAEFGDAQSGVVSYVTRRGGPKYTGSLETQTDQLGPDSWRTDFNRLEATLGGPISGPLTFFLAGTVNGSAASTNTGTPGQYVMDGVDVCPADPTVAGSPKATFSTLCTPGQPAVFQLSRDASPASPLSSVNVAAPRFVPYDNGRVVPFNWSDQYLFTGNLNYQLPRGSRLNLSYSRNRNQTYGRGGISSGGVSGAPCSVSCNSLFQTSEHRGALDLQNDLTVGGYFIVEQSANSQLALDLRASYQTDRYRTGILSSGWWLDHQDPTLGFSFSDTRFFLNPDRFQPLGIDVFHPDEQFIQVVRSNALPDPDALSAYPGRSDLAATQSLPGLGQTVLRSNPWAWTTNSLIPLNGFRAFASTATPAGLTVRDENRRQLRGTVDWQVGRFNRAKVGGEYLNIDVRGNTVQLYQGQQLPDFAQPVRAGAFLQDRLDLGDLVLEAGVRWDYLDPDISYPRTPGFVSNVPDSLQLGFLRSTTDANGNVVFVDKFEKNDCGGVSATNPNGTCISNFVKGQTKSTFSPRLGASFPVTPTSTFRLSYGRFVQTPPFFTSASFSFTNGVAGTGVGLLNDVNADLSTGANTNSTFARDVDLPSTTTFEFGYRQLIGEDLVVDLSAFNKKQRNGLTFRKVPYEDPTSPGKTVFLNVLTNQDFTESNGFEVKADKAIGSLLQTSLSYSFLDARGTGSDPFTFVGLVFRGLSNLSFITGLPEKPPEVLLPLEQSRKHNLSLTSTLTLPHDFAAGSAAGAIFRDLGLYSVLTVRSGLPFTKLINQGQGQIGPPSLVFSGQLQASISNLTTPWETNFDFRITKGFRLAGVQSALFADFRNPFGIGKTRFVYLETGNDLNQQFRTAFLQTALTDTQLDGDSQIRDFDIVTESPDNDFNKYMLLRAEQRFGNGDGVFTVAEQQAAFGQVYEETFGADQLTFSNQNLRIGLRLSF